MSETPEVPNGLLALQMGIQLHANMGDALEAAAETRNGAALEIVRGEDGQPKGVILHAAGINPSMLQIILATFAEMLENASAVHAPGCDCEAEVGGPELPEHRLVHDESGSPACACGWTPDRDDRAAGNAMGAVAIHIAVAGLAA